MLNSIKKFLIIVLLILAMQSCSSVSPSGEVYEKEYKPAQSLDLLKPIYTFINNETVISYVPYTKYVPEQYIIKIIYLENGKSKYYEYFVDYETYQSVEVGEKFGGNKKND